MKKVRPQAGVYLAHKPVGATSFAVVQEYQTALALMPGKALKVCHGGTLDPFATGLLPILVGPATKLFELLHELPKRYVATVQWGAETDSDDLGGEIIRRASAAHLTRGALEAALAEHFGWTLQRPPVMSNQRVEGERAYLRARRGEAVELEPKRVYLHAAAWRWHRLPECSELELTCRGGFYVRSLVRDLGRALGTAAHVSSLARVAIGPWADSGGPAVHVAGVETVPWLRRRRLTDDEWGRLRHAEPISRGELTPAPWAPPLGFPEPTPLVAATHGERLLALVEEHDRLLRTRLLLLPGLSPPT